MNRFVSLAVALAFFMPILKSQTALDRLLEGVEIGMARADFFEINKGEKAVASGESRTEYFEKAAEKGPLEGARFFFDNDGERFLYQIDLEYASEKAARTAAVEQFGQPNYPNRADHWIFDAFAGGATLGWIDGKKVTIAADLPETEWFGDALFQIKDPEILEQFEAPPPSEWTAEDWAFFDQSLEKQLISAQNQFKNLRGEVVGEAGSGMVDCREPLAFSIYASIFQDDENRWTASNTLAEGVSEASKKRWLDDFGAQLGRQKLGFFDLEKLEVLPEDGLDPADLLRFSVKFRKGETAVLVEIAAVFLGGEEGWAVDFLVVKAD